MNDKESTLEAILSQVCALNIPPPATITCPPDPADAYTYAFTTPEKMSEGFQGPNLKIDELSTIRKLLEQCTIDATKREVIHVLEAACSHPEECIECPYKNSLGECNRNERIADILLNRFGRVK